MDVPRMFALTRETNGPFDAVVGYGFVLPDGATYAVAWPTTSGAAFYSTSTAEQCADLRGADLQWIGDRTSAPPCDSAQFPDIRKEPR